MGKTEISEIYKPLYLSKKRYFFITGGRGSLKSTTVHDFISRLTYERGHGILFTRYTMTSAEKSIIPEFKIVAKRNGTFDDFTITKDLIVNNRTGSFIMFSGIKTSSGDQTANLKSVPGLTTWVIDEGEDFRDEKTFDDIDNSIRSINNQNRVIWIQNPSTREHFIYERWLANTLTHDFIEGFKVEKSTHESVEHIHSTYHIAEKYLNKDWILKAKKLKEENPNKYHLIYIGGWLSQAEGVVFENWDFGEFDTSLPFVYGMDFGSRDPDTLIKVAVDQRKMIIYCDELLYQNGLGTNELGQKVKELIVPNALVLADSASRRTIQDLYDMGINILRCSKSGKKVDWIKMMNDYKFIITTRSKNTARALNNYAWKNKGAELPDHEFSHIPDAIEYAFKELVR